MRKILVLVFMALVLVGCARNIYSINVNSLADGSHTSNKRYILISGNKEVDKNDLQFKEYAKQIEAALSQKGFILANNIDEADEIICLSYSISQPKTNIGTGSVPTYGQTGISRSQTYGTYDSGTGSYSGTTYHTPTYGVTGYSTYNYTYETYTRTLYLSSFAINHGEKISLGNQIWQTTAISTGASGDLRAVFPALVTAIKDHIGTNTGKQIEITVDEKDTGKIIR